MIRSYRQLDMQELEILNMTLEKLDVDPATPGEGRVWFSNGTSLPKIRANGLNRFLVAPDDDFNTLPIKDTLIPEDTMLIWDIERLEYKRIAAGVILSKMSTVKDVFKIIHSEYGVKDIVASGADELYFIADGMLLKTVGNDIGSKQVKYDLQDQAINSVLAGPLDVTMAKPTFRHLTDGDLPSSYNPALWNEASNFTQITTGNPTNVTMADLGYIVVTTLGTPGLDENLPTEKAVRVGIGLAIAALIDSSPDVLNTLNEISVALGNDPNFATTITTLISAKEPTLPNPDFSGKFLTSTSGGTRSWAYAGVRSATVSILQAIISNGDFSLDPWTAPNNGNLYTGNTNPTNTTRLNYDGYFHATKLFIGNSEVLSSGSLYSNSDLTPVALGGIPINSSFANKTMQEMWDSFLYPYQVPTLYGLSVTGMNTIVEVGTVIYDDMQTFTWGSTNPGNINTNSIVIRDESIGNNLTSGLPNSGSASINIHGPIARIDNGTYQQWSITATNTRSNLVAKSYFTVTWYSPFYYGVGAAGLSVSAIQALTKQVVPKSNKTYYFSPISQKYYFAYPENYGLLTDIIDKNGFPQLGAFSHTTQAFTINGVSVSYYVYEFNDLTSSDNMRFTFNF